MKKILLVLVMLVSSLGAFAKEVSATSDYKCVAPYDLTSGFSRFFTSASTANFWAEQYGEMLVKRIITQSLDSKAKVNLKSYGPVDLLAGRFKGFETTIKNLNAEGTHLSELELKTLCGFNYVVPDTKNNTVVFKEALPLSFHASVSEDDLNKTMKAVGYAKMISDLNGVISKSGGIKIQSTDIKVRGEKLYYTITTAIPFVRKPQEIVIVSNLKVQNGEIKFDNTKLLNDRFSIDLSKVAYVLNYLNPLDYSLKIIDNKEAQIKVKEVSIKENRINIDGIAVIPKDRT